VNRRRLELPTSALRTRAANAGYHLTRQCLPSRLPGVCSAHESAGMLNVLQVLHRVRAQSVPHEDRRFAQ
jgi:hypothetical protein